MDEACNGHLKIGILGCRGIPNCYGGYEQFAQHLGEGLQERGHQVWVYQSSLHPYQADDWKGVRLIRQPDPENKLGTFGQFIYDFNCLRDARSRGFDILLQLGYTSNAIWFPLWPSGPVNMIHMDGLEWKRAKYPVLVRFFLRWMERLAARRGEVLVADSMAISIHLKAAYRRDAVYIPYGAPLEPACKEDHLNPFGIAPGNYYLAVARLVPENNLAPIIEGVLDSGSALPILVIGDINTRHGQYLRNRYGGTKQVVFPGSIFDAERLNSLRRFARIYFHGHSVGGTNPSLLEAMACGVPICAHDNAFNRAVLGNRAYYFKGGRDISRLLAGWEHARVTAAAWVEENMNIARMEFNWEKIADSYEALFLKHNRPKKTGI